MHAVEEILRRRADSPVGADLGTLAHEPALRLAVLACLDARLDIHDILRLRPGDAHVLRNAGAIVTDDVIRSLAVSQRVLGTREVMVVGHTRCGMQTLDAAAFEQALERDAGVAPPWQVGHFRDVEEEVGRSTARLRESRFLLHTHAIRGFVFDVGTSELREVAPAAARADRRPPEVGV